MSAYLNFLAVAGAALLIPGPDTFVVLRTSLSEGARAGVWAAAGSASGNLIWGAASVLGIAGLLAASGTAFSALKLVGAAYLIFLGVQALLAAGRGDPLTQEAPVPTPASHRVAFRRGLASDVLNVKVGLFWTALVPQFVTAESSWTLPLAMVVSMGVLVFSWLAAYAYLAGRLTGTLTRPSTARGINGGVGAVLVALGARLGLAH